MQIYTCTKFKGHWPVGVAAVVVACNVAHARQMLEDELARAGLPQLVALNDMRLLCATEARAIVLVDGGY